MLGPSPSLRRTAVLRLACKVAGGAGATAGCPELWTRSSTRAHHLQWPGPGLQGVCVSPHCCGHGARPSPAQAQPGLLRAQLLPPGVTRAGWCLGACMWLSAASVTWPVAVTAVFVPEEWHHEQSPTSRCPVKTRPETPAEAVVVSWGSSVPPVLAGSGSRLRRPACLTPRGPPSAEPSGQRAEVQGCSLLRSRATQT